MIKLYTALGRYEIRKSDEGKHYPVVLVNLKESALSIEEMIMWSALIWNILTKDELLTAYQKRAIAAGVEPSRFEEILRRLEQRNLIASAEAIKGDEALYKLLANLYIVPIHSGLLVKITAFLHLTFAERLPFSATKIIFRKEKHNDMEKKVLNLSKQTLLSSAEVLKCIENDITDVSSSEKVINALYDDDYSTCDNLGLFMWFYENHRKILEAISTLYLNKNIIFDKIV